MDAERKARMAELRDIRLHLGCGRRVMEGWVNVDCFAAEGIAFEGDLREPLPFADSSVTMLYSEHVIEHLLPPEAGHFLRECHRVLQPGGIIRLGAPDAELYLRAYVSGDAAFFDTARNIGSPVSPLDTPMKIINQMARMGGHHHFAWDFQTLQLEMERAGFRQVVKGQPGRSVHSGLCLDDPSHAFETLYAEATKV
jgi:predicted SAM-dependent methyltransferase